MPKAPSRAIIYGVRPAALAKSSRAKLAKARALIAEVSVAWDDNFQGLSFDCEQILERIDALEPVIVEGVAYLNEPPEGWDA